jgi:GxxExxY protein
VEGHGGPAGDLSSAADENSVAREVVDAAYRVHTKLGPGLLESVYELALMYELERRGVRVIRQVGVPVFYDRRELGTGFVADLVVEDLVIVELKSVESVAPAHKKQLLTYLRLTNRKLGLLINFGSVLIKDGIFRIANGMKT